MVENSKNEQSDSDKASGEVKKLTMRERLEKLAEWIKGAIINGAGFVGAAFHNMLSKLGGEEPHDYTKERQAAEHLKREQKKERSSEKEEKEPSPKEQACRREQSPEEQSSDSPRTEKEGAVDQNVMNKLQEESILEICKAAGVSLTYNEEENAVIVKRGDAEQSIQADRFYRDREKELYKAIVKIEPEPISKREVAIKAVSIATAIDKAMGEAEFLREVSVVDSFGITTISGECLDTGIMISRNGAEQFIDFNKIGEDYQAAESRMIAEANTMTFAFEDKETRITMSVKAPDQLFINGRDEGGFATPIGVFKLDGTDDKLITKELKAYGTPNDLSPKAVLETVQVLSNPGRFTEQEEASGMYTKINARDIEYRIKLTDGKDFEVARFKSARGLGQAEIENLAHKIHAYYEIEHGMRSPDSLDESDLVLKYSFDVNSLEDTTTLTMAELAKMDFLPEECGENPFESSIEERAEGINMDESRESVVDYRDPLDVPIDADDEYEI